MLSRTKWSCVKRKRKRWEEGGSVWNLLLLYDASKTNYLKDISARGRAYGPSFADQSMETEHNTIPNLSEEKKATCFLFCSVLFYVFFLPCFNFSIFFSRHCRQMKINEAEGLRSMTAADDLCLTIIVM